MKACKVEGCERRMLARGWCATHYRRWYVNGDPLVSKRKPNGTLLKWLKEAIKDPGDECIVWPHCTIQAGYGIVTFNGQRYVAHRVALALHEGVEIPPADVLCLHEPVTCNNKSCINPKHLRWGTKRENALDMHKDGTFTHAKLTPAKVRCIKGLSDASEACLSHVYGVSINTIKSIRAGRNWSHIEGAA